MHLTQPCHAFLTLLNGTATAYTKGTAATRCPRNGTRKTDNMTKAASQQAGPRCQRLTYTERNGILAVFLEGQGGYPPRKQGWIQEVTYPNGVTKVWLHTGHYDRATGELIDCACTLSFRSVKDAKRYLTELTRYRRMSAGQHDHG